MIISVKKNEEINQNKLIAIYCLLVFIVVFNIKSQAQDRNYWSQMGGSHAGLLGGTAVAGLHDNNSMFYNPATMSFSDYESVSIAANCNSST